MSSTGACCSYVVRCIHSSCEWNASIWQTRIDGADDAINAILNILEAAFIWGDKIIQTAEALRDTYNEWLDWRNADPLFPWEEPIAVEVKIDNIAKYQTPVTVTCRDKTEYIYDSKWHTFTVNSSPMYNEFGDRAPHKCVITVTGVGKESGETKTVSTLPVTSYCFSGGTVHMRIVMPDDKGKSRRIYNDDTQINGFAKGLKRFDNLQFFHFLKNVFLPFFNNNARFKTTFILPIQSKSKYVCITFKK